MIGTGLAIHPAGPSLSGERRRVLSPGPTPLSFYTDLDCSLAPSRSALATSPAAPLAPSARIPGSAAGPVKSRTLVVGDQPRSQQGLRRQQCDHADMRRNRA